MGGETNAGVGAVDLDEDGVPDREDNCFLLSNPSQQDLDGDGSGDACDGDIDGDGIDNDADNCPYLYNTYQFDADLDRAGDDCDIDDDNDGLVDAEEERLGTDRSAVDTDGDGYSDLVELLDGTDPLLAADFAGHPRPEGGRLDGSLGACSAGGGDVLTGGADPLGGTVLLGVLLVLFVSIRRSAAWRRVLVAALVAACGMGVAGAAAAQSLDARAPISGTDGPYGELVRGTRGDVEHVSIASRYRFLRHPVVYRLETGEPYARVIEADHAGQLDIRVRVLDWLAALVSTEWTFARTGHEGFGEYHGAGMGDLTLGVAAHVPGETDGPAGSAPTFAHSVQAFWVLPTGDASALRGNGAAGGGILAASELLGPWYGALVNVGFGFRHRNAGADPYGLLRYGVGLSLFLPSRLIGMAAELSGGVSLDGKRFTSGVSGFLTHRQDAWFLRIGAGTDFASGGPGASTLRILADTGVVF